MANLLTIEDILAAIAPRGMGGGYGSPPTGSYAQVVDEPVPQRAPQFATVGNSGGDYRDRLALALSRIQMPQADNFGSGLASGFAQGFSGGRVQQMGEKERLNEALRGEAVEQNRRNWTASEAAKTLRAHQTQRAIERAQEMADQAKKDEKDAQGNSFEGMLAKARNTASVESIIGKEFPKPAAPDNEPLVSIQTPEGARFVRRGDAIGKEPAGITQRPKPPSAAERESLVGDVSTLKQVQWIRDSYNSDLTGPVSGRFGGFTQATGVGMRKGETRFRSGLASLRNQILKLRSGGAVTDGEAARLLEELPTVNDPGDAFMGKLDQFESLYRAIANARREVLSGTGVELSGIPPLPVASKVERVNGKLVRVQ